MHQREIGHTVHGISCFHWLASFKTWKISGPQSQISTLWLFYCKTVVTLTEEKSIEKNLSLNWELWRLLLVLLLKQASSWIKWNKLCFMLFCRSCCYKRLRCVLSTSRKAIVGLLSPIWKKIICSSTAAKEHVTSRKQSDAYRVSLAKCQLILIACSSQSGYMK